MKPFSSLVRRYPLAVFYFLAFFISWLGWLPQTLYAYGRFPLDTPLFNLLGGFGPTLAALLTTWVVEGRQGASQLFRPLFRWRAAGVWYAFVFLFWFGVAALALGIGTLSGAGMPRLEQAPWAALPLIFLSMAFSNVWEEIGWRGYALPRFQQRYSDRQIAAIMGLLWSLWHLPLLLNPASPMAELPWHGEVIFSLALTVIYTWLYNGTSGSLFFVTVFHAMANTVAYLLLTMGVFASSYWGVVGATAVFAAGILLAYRGRRFGRSP